MMAKRLMDIAGAVLLLLIALPVLLVTAIIIKAHDGGPVFYRQERVGLNGRSFFILKFRSMVLNADKIGSYSTAENDSRITQVGRILRRTSLDELPQLLNVLKGDMSLVGPRPDVPAQRSLYTEAEFLRRHSVRPGITGLAQATLRSSATQEERLKLDLDYVQRAGAPLDLWVMVLTVRQIIAKGGN